MADNLYVVLGYCGGNPRPLAICQGDEVFEDYKTTRDMKGLRTMVINRDHPKCPNIDEDLIYDNDAMIVDYVEDCPITKEEEECMVDGSLEINSHMSAQLNRLKEEVGKGYIRFSPQELKQITEMDAIIRKHIAICEDEDNCIDLADELDYKELLKNSSYLSVPFK